MFKISLDRPTGRFCDRIPRRQALQVGATSLLGGLSLPQLLKLETEAAAAEQQRRKAKSIIFLFLEGALAPSTCGT